VISFEQTRDWLVLLVFLSIYAIPRIFRNTRKGRRVLGFFRSDNWMAFPIALLSLLLTCVLMVWGIDNMSGTSLAASAIMFGLAVTLNLTLIQLPPRTKETVRLEDLEWETEQNRKMIMKEEHRRERDARQR